MPRRYTAVISSVAIAAAAELFFIEAPSDATLKILEIVITQDESETSEQLPLRIYRTTTDQGAKGDANTPSLLESGDAVFGGTVRTNILIGETFATPGEALHSESQNMLNGFHILPTPEGIIYISPGTYVVIKLNAAPVSSLNFSGFVKFEEIGG